MRHLISLKDQTTDDLKTILDMAVKIKANRSQGIMPTYLDKHTLIMMFQKTSTRTRLSYEAGMTELGGHGIFLDARTSQFALTDYELEIKAVMQYGSVLMFRALKADDVITAANTNLIPVIDACSEKYHPSQALGDILTMIEYAGGLENIHQITWLGVENNVSNTLMLACAKLGIKVNIAVAEANPKSVDPELLAQAEQTGLVERFDTPQKAVVGSDFVHTDTWMDMEYFQDGKVKPEFQTEYDAKMKLYQPFQLNANLIDTNAPKARIMHCMPCHLGYEISKDAVYHANSVILPQAQNRMHIQKAMILWLLEKENEVL
jgi:ornithine carbamoyltransferase